MYIYIIVYISCVHLNLYALLHGWGTHLGVTWDVDVSISRKRMVNTWNSRRDLMFFRKQLHCIYVHDISASYQSVFSA